jgi:hypothetical protein
MLIKLQEKEGWSGLEGKVYFPFFGVKTPSAYFCVMPPCAGINK